ncbi:hypothetical protein JCM16303_001099 [Sporobolomyces ruberrimus]
MLRSTQLVSTLRRSTPCALRSRLATTSSIRLLSSTSSRPAVGDSLPNIILPSSNPSLQITTLTPSAGYTLSDGLVLPSPILMIDGVAFMWDVKPPVDDVKGGSWDGFDTEKLKVFEVINPRPEILLVGTGKTGLFPPPKFKHYLNSLGIQVDVLDSRNAASTYNLLSEEGRRVAAALYPISELSARTGLTK